MLQTTLNTFEWSVICYKFAQDQDWKLYETSSTINIKTFEWLNVTLMCQMLVMKYPPTNDTGI